MNDHTYKPIYGVPSNYTEGMELIILGKDGTNTPAMVMCRVRFENGEFVPDTNGVIVEYLMDGDVWHDHVDKLNGKVVGFIPAYSLNNCITLQTPDGEIRGTVTAEEDEDGLIEVQTELPVDGRMVNLFTREHLDAMMISSPSTAKYIKPQKEDKQPSANNNPEDKSSFKNRIYAWLGCGFWIIVACGIVTLIYFGCKRDHERKLELKREYEHQKDSIAYAEDSIKREHERIDAKINSKEYKDSVAAVRKLRQDSIDRNTMVMIFKSDSLCHYSTICSEVKDIKSYQFTSQYNAKQQGKKICPECEEREDYYWGVKDGEYIYFEDINVQDD